MPIKRSRRFLYPIDWPIISRAVRFEVAGPHGKGRCWACGKPHRQQVRVLADGRWFDVEHGTWRDDAGREAPWPDIEAATTARETYVVLAACHRNHDPADVRRRNLTSWCQRHHLLHDRDYHRAQARITILLRRARGDLFTGPYRHL